MMNLSRKQLLFALFIGILVILFLTNTINQENSNNSNNTKSTKKPKQQNNKPIINKNNNGGEQISGGEGNFGEPDALDSIDSTNNDGGDLVIEEESSESSNPLTMGEGKYITKKDMSRYVDKKDRHYDQVLDLVGKRFAYAFYITQEPYFCTASITAHRLRQWTDIDIVFVLTDNYTPNPTIMERLEKLPNVFFRRFPAIQAKHDGGYHYFSQSLNKFYVFRLVEYTRIIFMDADTYVLKNLDHLFALPDCTMAAPMAYWLDNRPYFTNILMVLKPSEVEFQRILERSHTHEGWDMDVINSVYLNGDDSLLLPSNYGTLNVEFSNTDKHWLGDDFNHTYYHKTPLFHWTGFKPWLVHGEYQGVNGHGPLYAETWHVWDRARKLYC